MKKSFPMFFVVIVKNLIVYYVNKWLIKDNVNYLIIFFVSVMSIRRINMLYPSYSFKRIKKPPFGEDHD